MRSTQRGRQNKLSFLATVAFPLSALFRSFSGVVLLMRIRPSSIAGLAAHKATLTTPSFIASPIACLQYAPSAHLTTTRATPRHRSFYTKSSLAARPFGQATTTPARRITQSKVSASSYAVRFCSHQRAMCRHLAADSPSASLDVSKGREVLPKNVKPLHYDLTLEPNFKTFEYDGKVVIE